MLLSTLLTTSFFTLISAKASALPDAHALGWAKANPQAEAAAQAYADAYAEAIALAHPDPQAYALAASADDCASLGCHAACGYLILDGAACSQNETDQYSGPYNETCLCSEDSHFMDRYPGCMECGWTLWKYYGPYVTQALEACSTLSTEPTGTLRCSTTLSESYTKDANAGCAYGGSCVTSSSESGNNATATGIVSSNNGTSNGTNSNGGSSLTSSGGARSSDASASASNSGPESSGSSGSSASGSSDSSASSSSGSSSASNGAPILVAGTSIFGGLLVALLI
ncbi:putative secreted protein [Wickerhamomyces ciferrii]|uniref:Secreted protein n=1 Tax=Wickerhamomyces ciferrii (strain ATCC 14091 / BCRC 22168 / CBS 111 / JCM 3599 / NBRC 0793 / NRRL Y-1031 F-60-10) TaxID=1206466 RepID=K0KG98_WICCF|nr:uncharacterized protein BN7_1525 [Wickerhamomyces ciferrii]CCH41986.1 putative secreted protein [Wickerhamomyces ciferrii]